MKVLHSIWRSGDRGVEYETMADESYGDSEFLAL